MALVGNLRDLKLPNLIQLNCMERNTAKLTIDHAGKYGIIYFQDGQIVHAEFDPDWGEKALFRLLSLVEGKFKVESGVRPPLVTINTHWNNLLLDALHQLDATQSSDEHKDERLLDMLMNIKGVKKAAIINRDGEKITGEFEGDKEITLSALTFYEVEEIASVCKKERPQFMTLVSQSRRIILTEYDRNIIYIDLDYKYQLETILPFIEKVLR